MNSLVFWLTLLIAGCGVLTVVQGHIHTPDLSVTVCFPHSKHHVFSLNVPDHSTKIISEPFNSTKGIEGGMRQREAQGIGNSVS